MKYQVWLDDGQGRTVAEFETDDRARAEMVFYRPITRYAFLKPLRRAEKIFWSGPDQKMERNLRIGRQTDFNRSII